MGYNPWGHKESDMTERTLLSHSLVGIPLLKVQKEAHTAGPSSVDSHKASFTRNKLKNDLTKSPSKTT